MSGLFDGPQVPWTTERIVMERLRYRARTQMGPQVMQSLEFKPFVLDGMMDALLLQLEAEMIAYRIGGEAITRSQDVTLHLDVIDGPLQRWKDRHSNSWWLRRWVKRHPVRRVHASKSERVKLTVEVKDMAKFPENSMVFPDTLGKPVFERFVEGSITARRI